MPHNKSQRRNDKLNYARGFSTEGSLARNVLKCLGREDLDTRPLGVNQTSTRIGSVITVVAPDTCFVTARNQRKKALASLKDKVDP